MWRGFRFRKPVGCAPVKIEAGMRGSLEAVIRVDRDDWVSESGACEGEIRPADVRAPIERILKALTRAGHARAAVLRFGSEHRDGLRLVAATDFAESPPERIDFVEERCGICRDALDEAQVREARQRCACTLALGTETEQRVLAVPLRVRGEAFGVLSLFLDEMDAGAGLSPAVEELLPALADVLALTMETVVLGEADLHAGLMLQRHLIANEVHDSLAQNLASIRMRTSLLRDAMAKRDAARASGYLAEIDQSLALAQSRVRDIVTDYRSQMGATQLVPALENAVEELRAASGVDIVFDNAAREPRLSAFAQVQVFYIVREALTNALKHAHPSKVSVRLAEHGPQIELSVEDDGVGLDPQRNADRGHFGLNIMRERAGRVGGRVEFEAREGGGTRVRLRFPSGIETVETTT
jgi:nitrate/nitrite-specific signal transduction histidine kinase